jgi:pimeloyl-ACP methyl ester carboxylesterase
MDRFIRTNGLQLRYLEHLGDGPSIVRLPGLTANAHAFDGLVQAGLSPRFRALALDLRGRGRSDAPVYGYTTADHAAEVHGLLDALGIERATLAGHSFGGLLTFYLAAQYPARVTWLLVLDAASSIVWRAKIERTISETKVLRISLMSKEHVHNE